MPVCVCLCASMSLCLCLLVSVSVGRSVSRSAGRADGRSLSVGRSIYVWTYLPIYLSIYLYRYLFFRQGWGGSDLSVSLSLSLFLPSAGAECVTDPRQGALPRLICGVGVAGRSFASPVRLGLKRVSSLSLSPPPLSSLRFFASPEKESKGRGPAPRRPPPHLSGGRSFGIFFGRAGRGCSPPFGKVGGDCLARNHPPLTLARVPASSPRSIKHNPWLRAKHFPLVDPAAMTGFPISATAGTNN